ncbi:MAG: hypothetical protein N838_33905, partial [Thiohalocapsa sp. PB-PSB1]
EDIERLREATILALCLAWPDLADAAAERLEALDCIAPDHAALLAAILEHYQSGAPAIEGADDHGGHAESDGPDNEIVRQIKVLLDTRVRPAVAQDGGDIVFHGFDRGVVYLHMQGACAGCPSSTLTLKMGIENLLRHYIPDVTEVRPVVV